MLPAKVTAFCNHGCSDQNLASSSISEQPCVKLRNKLKEGAQAAKYVHSMGQHGAVCREVQEVGALHFLHCCLYPRPDLQMVLSEGGMVKRSRAERKTSGSLVCRSCLEWQSQHRHLDCPLTADIGQGSPGLVRFGRHDDMFASDEAQGCPRSTRAPTHDV